MIVCSHVFSFGYGVYVNIENPFVQNRKIFHSGFFFRFAQGIRAQPGVEL